MKKHIASILPVSISLVLICFLIFANEVIISVRLEDFKTYLQNLDRDEGGVDHIVLVATYEIHKKIYEERITQDTADLIEQKLNTLSLSVNNITPQTLNIYGIFSYPAVEMINFNRRILGKPPVKYNRKTGYDFKDLDLAYYYERNFLYKAAASQYDRALRNKNLSVTLKASILLRQGYCCALTGNTEKAMNNYQAVITDYSQESSAITASILIRYLEGFRLARERVLVDEKDPVLKSQKLVSLLAYKDALDIINSTELKSDPKDFPRINYFKARCYSGLGQPEKAVENYLRVITSAPESPYAKYSNRKLFLIGTSAGGNNRILEMSKQLNKKLDDQILTGMINVQDEKTLTPAGAEDLIKFNIPVPLQEKVAKMTAAGKPGKDIHLVILTSDGNTFRGKLIEKKSDIISLQTSIGKIDVKRDKITKITEK